MRVKTGITRRKRHKKVLARTKGMRMTKGRLYKVSKEADLHAGQYAYVGRKRRKREMRRLWIQRIKAALGIYYPTISYSQFVSLLKKAKIEINRKMLADLALSDENAFRSIIDATTRVS